MWPWGRSYLAWQLRGSRLVSRRSLRPAHSSTGPDPFLSFVRTVVPLDKYVDGHDKVRVKVRAVVR